MQRSPTASQRTAGKAIPTTSKRSQRSQVSGDNYSTNTAGGVREARLQLYKEQKELELLEKGFEDERRIKKQFYQLQKEEEELERQRREQEEEL